MKPTSIIIHQPPILYYFFFSFIGFKCNFTILLFPSWSDWVGFRFKLMNFGSVQLGTFPPIQTSFICLNLTVGCYGLCILMDLKIPTIILKSRFESAVIGYKILKHTRDLTALRAVYFYIKFISRTSEFKIDWVYFGAYIISFICFDKLVSNIFGKL